MMVRKFCFETTLQDKPDTVNQIVKHVAKFVWVLFSKNPPRNTALYGFMTTHKHYTTELGTVLTTLAFDPNIKQSTIIPILLHLIRKDKPNSVNTKVPMMLY